MVAGRTLFGAIIWFAVFVVAGGGISQSDPRSITPDAIAPDTQTEAVSSSEAVSDRNGEQPDPAAAKSTQDLQSTQGTQGGTQNAQSGSGPGDPGGAGGGVLGKLPASLFDNSANPGRLGVVPASAVAIGDGRALVDLFGKISGPMPSPELQTITHEFLLDRGFLDLGAQVDLARAQALYRLGFIEDAAGAIVARENAGVAARAATARMLLALGQRRNACERADVSGFPQGASEGPTFELLRILGYCKLVAGNPKAARLIASLLREQGGADQLYTELMKAKPSTKRVARAKFKRLLPVHVALFAKVAIPVPAKFVAKADPALLAGMARNAALVETRVAAAERGVSLGLLAIKDLESLYSEIDLSGADPARLISQMAKKKASVSRVLARAQMIGLMIDGSDRDRVGLARAAFTEARRAGVARAVVEFVGEELAGVETLEGFGAQATGTAIEILTMADRPEAAIDWLDAGEAGDATGKPTLSPLGVHRGRALIMVLAPGTDLGLRAGVLGAEFGTAKISKRDRAFIRTEAALLGALGDYVPPVLMEISGKVPQVADLGDVSNPVAMLGVLAPFSNQTYSKVPLDKLVRGLGALRALGLDTDARRVAVDALIARSSRS
ncbi:MAG: hypothetical protein ACTSY1_07400 [Alphaproteobacteria bacterium]